ncbi:response regulator [Luteolibacter pohnpeiensis]|uniref:histidine kinase n=1 Tax=Luteolibacter pohnpeiensis TaxID=454153 RepID=A0A934S5F2_9BACT|nr:response regulator [Luteolibacter pohnpeiensis]MBK1882193.1 response regulator [Luteolibacter pohnpeiensis]
MNRFKTQSAPIALIAAGVTLAAVYVVDFFSDPGIAVFILFLVPVVLTFFSWRPLLPIIAGFISTTLILMNYIMTPVGPNPEMVQLNRSFCILTLWVVSAIGMIFIRARLVSRRENWLRAGQTELGIKLVGEQWMDALGDGILKFLCGYLDAQAGAMFVEDGTEFHRVSTYAAAVDSVPKTFSKGDGVLSQAVKDGQCFVVSDVPDGYLSVGSSFGKSAPRHLLVMPIHVEGQVKAVLELGFFKPVQESDKELLARVESSIGVAIRSVKYRMRLRELLEQTQQQSEEVQAQSEELRVSNEELEEQSRALMESQSRLELQQTELEQNNVQLEEQTQMLEQQKRYLVNAKEALEKQAWEVERASRYKSDFLANMSHELRTPLNSSLILAKLLAENRNGNLTDEQIKFAQTIESSGNDLLVLINDVLDLSKIEAGHMEIHPERMQLDRLVNTLQDVFEPVATQKSLGFQIEIGPQVPDSLITDRQRLEQVLKNLLSNALKFTESGSVALRISRTPGDQIAFAVSDTGIGIESEQQQAIFDPFFQGDGTTSRKYGGTGLGLSISRNLTRLLGGEIDLVSEAGKGTTFTVTLPEKFESSLDVHDALLPLENHRKVEPPTANLKSEEPVETLPTAEFGVVPDDRETLNGSRPLILAVEDDRPFAEIIYHLAHEMDFQCIIATSAEEALVLARGHLPSAIVLDVGLPDNSGLIVLERLKSDSKTRHIPVHVVSASDYTQTAMALGAVGYMLKPVKREELALAFRNLEQRLTQKMRRVLVVEDDPVQMEAMSELLGSRDVETLGARTAAECLEHLKSTSFDCMVLDLSLPDESGFSLLEKLSQEDTYSFPPVIVYTGRELSGMEEQRLRKYSKSIIIKGAKSHERLLDEVSLFLHQVVSDLPPEKQRMLEKASNRDAALEGRRILVAEDDVRNVFALTSLLEGRGVKLQIARNGREAVDALDRAAKDPKAAVDLVLMDIMMPEMDGLAAMREIRKRREWSKLPIIALTAKAMKSDQEQCLAAGANDYLAKPLDVEKLLSLIRVWMPR